ncbi:phage terminase large subunit-like protein [Nocardioides sp. BE266]|uniref:terminase large subunit n=1 Tax=Nocardioides sp. BE266 TaxID=2817725 RepID=UPI0028561F33|nr:terminase TerL endonuclease subunit [Nocardioides sp. BE266]MDR7253719.1 phage terminase large subunit-like protein [Nocardioides sp. BE266]
MKTTPSTDLLPVPRDALLELGLTEEQITDAEKRRPLVVAFQADKHPGAWFDVERARKALKAIGAFKHTKGRWAGVSMRLGEGLDPWQVVWVLAPIFGWVYHDAEIDRVVRVIRSAWIEIPRKNGKSTFASGISGVLLLADGEAGAEVYNAAGSTLQAGRVFEDAKRMILTSPAARKRVEPLKEVVRVPASGGMLRVLSRVAETAHGLNVSGGIIDEVHTLRLRRALVEAIETGTGARDQPLIIFITTADEAEEGTIYDEKHGYTRNVASGIVEDPGHYGVIWAADDTDDPFAEETWAKANPGLGKSPTLAYMRRESQKAQTTPTYLPTFLRLSLNRRTREQVKWLDLAKWDLLDDKVDRASLRGRRAWGGLDLSAVSDFTAWAVWVESKRPGASLDLLARFWVPEDRVEDLARKLPIPLQKWIADGWVETTEGDVIDYAAIKSAVVGDCQHFDMQRVSYDRMFAGQMVQELDADIVWPVSQSYSGLSPACKELERLVGAQAFRHGGNPVLRWMADVVEVKNDGSDNIRPVKPDRRRSSTRIDGIQAAVTALDGIVRAVEKPQASGISHAMYGFN